CLGQLQQHTRMIRLVVPGAIDQPTGGYRYDAALLKALQWSGIDAEVVEIHDLDDPLHPQALLRERQSAMPVACHLIVDGLALSPPASRAPALLQAFTRTSSQHSSLIALVHHPLCDETGVDHEQQDVLRKLEHEALQQVDLIIT